MRRLLSVASMMLIMATVSVSFTSCGDDEEPPTNEQTIQQKLVGTWIAENDFEDEPFFEKATTSCTLYADGTYIITIQFPQDFKGTLSEGQAQTIDDECFFQKQKGHWYVKDDKLTITIEEDYCFEEYGDWEWHQESETETVTIILEGDKMTTNFYDEETKTTISLLVYNRKK